MVCLSYQYYHTALNQTLLKRFKINIDKIYNIQPIMETNYIQVGNFCYIFDTNRIIKNTGFVPILLKINLN